MTARLFVPSTDGSNYQARAVKSYLEGYCGLEASYIDEYRADPRIARWENCREQGYVISMRSSDSRKQVNIAFFQHL